MRNYEEIARKVRELEAEGKYKERNRLVPIWREAYYNFDFGFREGEEVRVVLYVS